MIIMTLVAHYNLELHQIDVKIIFHNGNLQKKCLYGPTNGILS